VPFRTTAEDEWGGSMMRRLNDGWCAALDRNTMRFTICERQSDGCREFEMGASGCIQERLDFYARPGSTLAASSTP
jgi:hypothetical protein